ncbi:MAG: substrate-binding domain-containing protein [Verrucomicrobia bacterium]|nr:substrate-binding domain-containing protein [Verrucomicrobiota bacterium]MCH8512732.1 substrate-binding domain-containing protein [Kiritimatiellia bacterium]
METKKLITLLLPAVATSMQDIVRGVADYARERGNWHVVLHIWGNVDPETLAWIQRGDGVIFASQLSKGTFADWAIPAVGVQSSKWVETYPLVSTNYVEIGRMAARYFHEKGLNHFAFLSYEFSTFLERGLREQAETYGRELSCHYLRGAQPELDPNARKALCDWLEALPPPVGLLVRDDFLAQRVMDWIPRDWLPERIAVLGVGNDQLIADITNPTLSSIDRGARRVGYKAAEVLDRMISGEAVPPGRIDLPPDRVVERASTGLRYTSDPLVTRGVRLLEENLDRPLSTQELCKQLHVSRRTLERRFLEALGRTPGQQRQFLRLSMAKTLLQNSREPMSVIAERCGYKNQQRFSEAFRRAVGIPPTQFQAERKEAPHESRRPAKAKSS